MQQQTKTVIELGANNPTGGLNLCRAIIDVNSTAVGVADIQINGISNNDTNRLLRAENSSGVITQLEHSSNGYSVTVRKNHEGNKLHIHFTNASGHNYTILADADDKMKCLVDGYVKVTLDEQGKAEI